MIPMTHSAWAGYNRPAQAEMGRDDDVSTFQDLRAFREKPLYNSSPISQCKYYSQLVLSSLLIYIYANIRLECSMSPASRVLQTVILTGEGESGGCACSNQLR